MRIVEINDSSKSVILHVADHKRLKNEGMEYLKGNVALAKRIGFYLGELKKKIFNVLDVDVYLVDAADYYDKDAMKHKKEHEKKMIQLCKELYRKMSDI